MHIYILSKSVGCYKMKKLLPKRFHNVDLKMDKEYKKWKKAEDKKFDDKIVKFDDKCWWDSLDNEGMAVMRSMYPIETKETACKRRWRFIAPSADFFIDGRKYPKQKQKYKIIDKSYFNLPCDVYKN